MCKTRPNDSTALFFSRSEMEMDGKKYHQLIAVDLTEQYRITAELKEKNERLLDIQHRIKVVSALSGDMFEAQEIVGARTALHDHLGQVLLMGRHYLEHPDTTDAQLVHLATQQMNSFLLREAEEPVSPQEDDIGEALRNAEAIGVAVHVTGELPAAEPGESLTLQAIRECAINAAKHAGADTLFVTVIKDKENVTVTITNNGSAPKAPIVESGGLKALREAVETAGGTNGCLRSSCVFSCAILSKNQFLTIFAPDRLKQAVGSEFFCRKPGKMGQMEDMQATFC